MPWDADGRSLPRTRTRPDAEHGGGVELRRRDVRGRHAVPGGRRRVQRAAGGPVHGLQVVPTQATNQAVALLERGR